MLVGAIIGHCIAHIFYNITDAKLIAACIGLTLPAAFDFTGHELLSKYRSTNIKRFVTGGLFGLSVGGAIACALCGRCFPLICLLVFLALMQFFIAALFQFHGQLEPYIERYASAAIIEDHGPKIPITGTPEDCQGNRRSSFQKRI